MVLRVDAATGPARNKTPWTFRRLLSKSDFDRIYGAKYWKLYFRSVYFIGKLMIFSYIINVLFNNKLKKNISDFPAQFLNRPAHCSDNSRMAPPFYMFIQA